MFAIIIVNAVIRDLFKEKIEKSRVQKTFMFSLLRDYKCQLPENKISWHNKATVINSQQKKKQKEPDIELKRSNFNSADI